jgi:hypothetical protein
VLEFTAVVVLNVCSVDSVDLVVEQLSPLHGVTELIDEELVCVDEVTVESELGFNPSVVVSCVVIFSDSVVSAISDSVVSTVSDSVVSTISDSVVSTISDSVVSTVSDSVVSTVSDSVVSTISDSVVSTISDSVVSTISDSVVSTVSDSVEEIVLLNVDVETIESELDSSDVVISVVSSVSVEESGSNFIFEESIDSWFIIAIELSLISSNDFSAFNNCVATVERLNKTHILNLINYKFLQTLNILPKDFELNIITDIYITK